MALHCGPNQGPEYPPDPRIEALQRELAALRSQLAGGSAMPPHPSAPPPASAAPAAAAVDRPLVSLGDHARQPRDETWAPAAEASLSRELAAEAAKLGFSVVVECRTTSCRVNIGVPDLRHGDAVKTLLLRKRFTVDCVPNLPEIPPPGRPFNAPFDFDALLDCTRYRASTVPRP